jgi:hypothetical protein
MSCGKLGAGPDIDSHRSPSSGGSHVQPRAARPQRQQHRRGRLAFYTRLFGAEPAKLRPGYASFAITEPPLKLVLLENPGHGGSLNHLGVEVPDIDTVDAEQARLAGTGLASVDERDTTCCYARQDKFWVQGAPDGESWEIYTVLADSQTFYDEDPDAPECCATDASAQAEPAASAGRCC